MALIRLEHLTKVFGAQPSTALGPLDEGADRKRIYERTGQTVGVADVSFEVECGQIVVVMGLSGSGKSTLVRCINRLIEPTHGKVFVDDQEVTALSRKRLIELRRRKIGMVFQHFGLFPHRTVLENAGYGLEVVGTDRDRREEKARRVLKMVGLEGQEHNYPAQLSGGMQQRVGLARALAGDPEIILMDEALSALDPLIRKQMQGELLDLQQELGKTIVFITHDLDEAIRLGDRIVLMKDGRVVQKGTAEDVLTRPASEYVAQFVEDVDMATVLTAESVMRPVGETVRPGDGAGDALRKMKSTGLSMMFAVDEAGKLVGVVHAGRAAKLARHGARGGEAADQLIERPARRVRTDTPLHAIVPLLAEDRDAVAVVDDSGTLQGVVVRGALLAGLAEGERSPEDVGEASGEPAAPPDERQTEGAQQR